MSTGRLHGRTALITGASRGIGQAIACAYAAEGASLFLAATSLDNLEGTRELIAQYEVAADYHAADVADSHQVDALFATAAAWRGGLDIVVNNAGIYLAKPFVGYELAEFDRLMKVNVNAICPGLVETDMLDQFRSHADALGVSFDEFKKTTLTRVPMGRFLAPDEIAPIAVYLGSSESDGMTGQTITISGGMRMG